MVWNTDRSTGEILTSTQWDEVIAEISTGRVPGQSTDFVSGQTSDMVDAYAPRTGSTEYAADTGSTNYVAGQTTDFVSGTSTQFSPLEYNKTVVLYAGNSMIATTTYATLGQELTTANNINFIYGEFSTIAGDRMQWGIQMDQGWNSSNLYATFNWAAKTSEVGNVVWELSGVRIGDNTTMHNALASLITSTDTCQASSTAFVFHRSAETTNFLVGGAGNYVTFDLTRKVATDTLSTKARILNVELRGTYASTY